MNPLWIIKTPRFSILTTPTIEREFHTLKNTVLEITQQDIDQCTICLLSGVNLIGNDVCVRGEVVGKPGMKNVGNHWFPTYTRLTDPRTLCSIDGMILYSNGLTNTPDFNLPGEKVVSISCHREGAVRYGCVVLESGSIVHFAYPHESNTTLRHVGVIYAVRNEHFLAMVLLNGGLKIVGLESDFTLDCSVREYGRVFELGFVPTRDSWSLVVIFQVGVEEYVTWEFDTVRGMCILSTSVVSVSTLHRVEYNAKKVLHQRD